MYASISEDGIKIIPETYLEALYLEKHLTNEIVVFQKARSENGIPILRSIEETVEEDVEPSSDIYENTFPCPVCNTLMSVEATECLQCGATFDKPVGLKRRPKFQLAYQILKEFDDNPAIGLSSVNIARDFDVSSSLAYKQLVRIADAFPKDIQIVTGGKSHFFHRRRTKRPTRLFREAMNQAIRVLSGDEESHRPDWW